MSANCDVEKLEYTINRTDFPMEYKGEFIFEIDKEAEAEFPDSI